MYYNTLFVGMDVHKENFTLCCYDMMQDKILYTQKLEPDYNQILKYLTFVRKAFRKDVDFVCGYEAGCLGFTLYHQLTRHGVSCVILAPTTMMKPAGKKKSRQTSGMPLSLPVVWPPTTTAPSTFPPRRTKK